MKSIDRIVAQDAARTYAQNTDASRTAAATAAAQQASNLASLKLSTYKRDSVTLSDKARSLGAARQAVKNSPDVRQQKVVEIKQQLSDGTYTVSPSVLARNMLDATAIQA